MVRLGSPSLLESQFQGTEMQSSYVLRKSKGWEDSSVVDCLCKHGDLNSNLWHPHKRLVVATHVTPVTSGLWEMEREGWLGLAGCQSKGNFSGRSCARE